MKTGLDDFLCRHSVDEFNNLPREEYKPLPERIETATNSKYRDLVQDIACVSDKLEREMLCNKLADILKASRRTLKKEVSELTVSSENSEDNMTIRIESYLAENYDLRYNLFTSRLEDQSGRELCPDEEIPLIYYQTKREFPRARERDVELALKYIAKKYNPIMDFFEKYKNRRPAGVIEKLASSIVSITGYEDEDFWPEYVEFALKHWLVGMIAAAHGQISTITLVLAGNRQGIGKTEFFRRLFPSELKKYFVEHRIESDKDFQILTTKCLCIFDDDLAGITKGETHEFKMLTSKDYVTAREAYGKKAKTLKRIAVFCGTSNTLELLNDPTGNRRILPVNITNIDKELYNSIDKIDVFMEAYWLYKEGFLWELNRDEIQKLMDSTKGFEKPVFEWELLDMYAAPPIDPESNQFVYTASEIKLHLDKFTSEKTKIKNISSWFVKRNFTKGVKWKPGTGNSVRGWRCRLVEPAENQIYSSDRASAFVEDTGQYN